VGGTRLEFDALLWHLGIVGFLALAGWALAAAGGIVTDRVTIAPLPPMRFVLAILVLVFARRTYWRLREWWWRRLPPDERFGFANPLLEHARSSEHASPS
jgi:hypothetical protein